MSNDSINNARTAEQATAMKKAAKKGSCLFCEIDFERNKPLNKQGEFDPAGSDWPLLWVWKNPFPQEHHKLHLMIIPRRHIENEAWDSLTNEEWLQILDAWKWAQNFFKIAGGGFVGRFGSHDFNAGTIEHLHFQLQAPNGSGNVKATFCKDHSPESEIKRANRQAYFQDEVIGFIFVNNNGEFLTENLRWQRNNVQSAFVHAASAKELIKEFLEQQAELQNVKLIWKAIWKKGPGINKFETPLDQKTFFSQ